MDLAETVDDLICIFDGRGGDTTMDTLAMFVFGWALAALFVLWLGRLAYGRFLRRAIERTVAGEEDLQKGAANDVLAKPGAAAVKKTNSLPRTTTSGAPTPSSTAPTAGGAVPSTPTLRKRLTRQSPGPDRRRTPSSGPAGAVSGAAGAGSKFTPAPQCTGADNVCVLWVNDILQWMYTDQVISGEVIQTWLKWMNEYCGKAAEEQGVGVEFVRVLPETHPPNLYNIFAECDSKDDVTITCDFEATPAFQVKCHRRTGERIDTCHYRVNVNRFRGRMHIACVSEKLLANARCDGWPEIKVALAPVGNIKPPQGQGQGQMDETQLQEVVSEIVTTAMRNTETHFNLAIYPNCPRLVRHVETPMSRFHFDGGAYSSTPTGTTAVNLAHGKRLLVKIVRAAQLGVSVTEPYCIVEMDEPPQKNQTGVQKTQADSPVWDEHFLFELSPHTAEVLMEVYDGAARPPRFLGLGIVGMDELLVNPAQRQIISLQGRPYEADPVSGTLTVEFMFVDGNDIPSLGGARPFKIKESIPMPPSATNRALTPNRTRQDGVIMNGDHQPMRHSPMDNRNDPNRNTLVIHSVQRQPSQRLVKVELNDGSWREVERVEMPSLDSCDSLSSATGMPAAGAPAAEAGDVPATNGVDKQASPMPPNASNNIVAGQLQVMAPPGVGMGATGAGGGGGTLDSRGRPKKRRDFFGTIKRRLGRKNQLGRDDSANRSISADRNNRTAHSDGSRLHVGNTLESSRRSSISEASGLSTASTRTYINEASNLVLETIENGVKKHYLVPLSLAQKSRWRKKGTKLHIFNDHTFIAKHLTGGTICQVCSKSVARRIGKQGYECRDCLLKCHKHCHVKVNDNCPTSTIHNIELSYIQNPLIENLKIL